MNFFTSVKSPFYKKISDWIDENPKEELYIYPSQQNDENIYDFCSAVLDKNKTPILIVPNGGWDRRYPSVLQNSINLSGVSLILLQSLFAPVDTIPNSSCTNIAPTCVFGS